MSTAQIITDNAAPAGKLKSRNAYLYISIINEMLALFGPPLVMTIGSYNIWNTEMTCKIRSVFAREKTFGNVMYRILFQMPAGSISRRRP